MRIGGSSKNRIVGLVRQRQLWRVGFTHKNGTGSAESRNADRVVSRSMRGATLGAPGGIHIKGVETIFDGHGNAMEWADDFPFCA